METINERIKMLRKSLNMTQEDVAKTLLMSTRNYQRYETGVSSPPLSVLSSLSRTFNVSIDYLLHGAPAATLDRLMDLIRNSGKSYSDLEYALLLKRGTIKAWESGESTSYENMLVHISEFFGVSLDYLLCFTDNPLLPYSTKSTAISGKSLDLSGLSKDDIKKVEEYIELLRIKNKAK